MGYSHNDLKPGNICARQNEDESFKFTLIDLGMSAKIPSLGHFSEKKYLRGNLMFASVAHITKKRAS